MKTKIVGFVLLGLAGAALAVEPQDLDNRIHALTEKLEILQEQPDKCIPPETLRQAQGIILLDRTKAGFLFAYQGGGGVAMVKDPATDKWSPVAFMDANEASLGFQVGGEHNFYAVLLMTTNANRLLIDKKFEFAGEARATAGNATSGVATGTPSEPSVLVYDDRLGLYAGAALKGGAVTPADEANHIYYGQYVSISDILFGHTVQPTAAALALASKIQAFSKNVPAGRTTAEK